MRRLLKCEAAELIECAIPTRAYGFPNLAWSYGVSEAIDAETLEQE